MTEFGVELRRRRLAAEMTLTGLAERLGYSKGYLSKIERGTARPSVDLARSCDAVFCANGDLAAMAVALADNSHQTSGLVVPDQLVVDGLLDQSLPLPSSAADLENTAVTLGLIFNQCRVLGDRVSSRLVYRLMVPHAQTVVALAHASTVPDRSRELWMLAAYFVEHTGYMAQESGDYQAALYWTHEAVGCGARAEHGEMAAFGLVRQAEIALYRESAAMAIDMARRAQEAPRSPAHVRRLAAQREAQGHGLAGAYLDYKSALDQAMRYAKEEGNTRNSMAWEMVGVRNSIAVTAGWALHDLGRSAVSARILDWEVPRIHAESVRVKARFGVRQALAHASVGHVERACELTRQLLPDVERLDSDTIRLDLRRLMTSLNRWNGRSSVRGVQSDLVRALAVPERLS